MSKFDAILKRIEEQTGITASKPQTGVQTNTPVTNTSQAPVHLKNPQAIEKVADEIANINDPNKIKQILAQLIQAITKPLTNS